MSPGLVATVHVTTVGFVAICGLCMTISAAIAGIFFRGAAIAWKSERDAAVDKADRLEARVNEQETQILALNAKVAYLEDHSADQVAAEVSRLAEHMIREHRDFGVLVERLVGVIDRLDGSVHANTAAVEVVAHGSVIKDALNDHDREADAT